LQKRLQDPANDPEAYERDMEYCKTIAEYMDELLDIATLAAAISQHISWSQEESSEARKSLALLKKQFQWHDPQELQTLAKASPAEVLQHRETRNNLRERVRRELIDLRPKVLSGEMTFVEARDNALKSQAERLRELAYSEAFQQVYTRLQQESKSDEDE
jgi:hypothetical protein